MEYVPHVPCSKIEPCDLGSTSKSLQATKVKLQAQIRRLKGDVPTRSATGCHGVPREPKPPDLSRGEHHLLRDCPKSSPTLRSKGNTPLFPSFNGENSRAFVSWLFDVECYFENKCFSDKEKCKLVVSSLKGVALLWYNTLTFSRRMEGKGRICSWFKLERNMRLKFLPSSTMGNLLAELKTLKQNSLSVHEYSRLFEELHFVCDNEFNPFKKIRFYLGLKSEIARKINLKMMHSYGELLELALYVEDSLARPKNHEVLAKGGRLEAIKTVGKEEELKSEMQKEGVCLVSLESKVKDVHSPKEEDVGDVLAPKKVEEPAPTHPTQVLVEKEHEVELVACSSIYLSPLELSINKKLQQPLSLKMDNFLSSFEGEKCWDTSKGEAKGGARVVPYLSVSNLNSCTRSDLCFKTNILEGITCQKPAPHFNFYMLVRLQVSLVHLGAIPYMLMGIWMSEQTEFGNGTTSLLPYTILVYDPGGRHENVENLRANSFEEREFATKVVAL